MNGSRFIGWVIGTACFLSTACASIEFERTSENAGVFTSSATAFTVLSFDIPAPAISIARANAADSGRPQLIIESERVIPYLGPFDWILDFIGIRWARVNGTWGEPPAE